MDQHPLFVSREKKREKGAENAQDTPEDKCPLLQINKKNQIIHSSMITLPRKLRRLAGAE